MKKFFLSALIIPALLLSTVTITEASTKVMWGKTELVKGQIGKVTVLNTTQVYQNNKDGIFKQSTRSLRKGDEFRVYSYKGQDGGFYGLGGGLFVKKSTVVKYETPSKSKLILLENNTFSNTPGKKYPDGWVAPVLKSAWSPNPATNFATLQNELGFYEGGHFYGIKGKSRNIIVNGDSGENEVTFIFYSWTDRNLPDSYRIPIVAKELFKLYFGADAERVWNYNNNNDIPEQFTANGRTVKVSYIEVNGSVYFQVGKKK